MSGRDEATDRLRQLRRVSRQDRPARGSRRSCATCRVAATTRTSWSAPRRPTTRASTALADGLALVQTLDFFPPLVDDPFTFGQIAAANALSDVYAMNGRPITAMNIVGFPDDELPLAILAEILRGAADRVALAGAVTVGGTLGPRRRDQVRPERHRPGRPGRDPDQRRGPAGRRPGPDQAARHRVRHHGGQEGGVPARRPRPAPSPG